MTKRVTVEELREHLDDLRNGEPLTLTDNGEDIARIEPSLPLRIVRHDPALRLQDFKPGLRPPRLDFDAVQWLIDERERERSGKKYGL